VFGYYGGTAPLPFAAQGKKPCPDESDAAARQKRGRQVTAMASGAKARNTWWSARRGWSPALPRRLFKRGELLYPGYWHLRRLRL